MLFNARRYANAVYAVIVSVCPSVRLTQTGIVTKRLNLGSCKENCMIAQGL